MPPYTVARVRAVERARADLAAGRAWKARDRLLGALAAAPADQELLGLLGEVQHGMGDLPAAGRAWFCTERSGPEVDHALEAWRERHGGSAYEMWTDLPRRLRAEDLPPVPARRVARLRQDAVEQLRARRRQRHGTAPEPRRDVRRDVRRGQDAVFGVVAVLTVGLLLTLLVVGLVVTAQTVWAWLT